MPWDDDYGKIIAPAATQGNRMDGIDGPALPWPSSTDIHIWQFDLQTVPPHLPIESWLSPDERNRAARFKVTSARDRFILCRGGLRYLLSAYLGCHPATLRFGYGPHGKPYLITPACSLQFNLAHSGLWAIYTISRCQWVGIDIEQMAPRRRLEALIDRCLTAAEQADLPAIAAARQQRFFQHWTIKEAHLKAVGLGLSYPMSHIQIALRPMPMIVTPAVLPDNAVADWWVRLWQPTEDAIAAICVGQAAPAPTLYEFTLPLTTHPNPKALPF